MTPGQVETAAVAVAVAVAVATLGYRLGADEPAGQACAAALAALLVAVPSALRLGTAAPRLVAAGRAAQLGIPVVDAPVPVDTIVLAGTGILTGPQLQVHDVRVAEGVDAGEVLRLAGAVAQESGRPVDRAIAASSDHLPGVADFDGVGDLGVRGVVAEVVTGADGTQKVVAHAVLVGRVEFLTEHDVVLPPELVAAAAEAAACGRVPVAVAWDGVARAVLAVGRAVAPSHVAAVGRLHALGLRPVLLTAQTAPAVRAVADLAGIDADAVVAGIGPHDEAGVVRGLQAAGARVAVVADEDAHQGALAAADLAVRAGAPDAGSPGGPGAARITAAGARRARRQREIAVPHGGLPAAVDAMRLSRRATAVARVNVACTLACLAGGLPAAATGLLGPMPAAVVAAAAATVVLTNSLRLQRLGTTDR
ncbi:MAG TPA: hypothetical protein VD903_06080 [Pseudonocardia sp.]|nr:hypothetical protein [Pseudonocardia sp.]